MNISKIRSIDIFPNAMSYHQNTYADLMYTTNLIKIIIINKQHFTILKYLIHQLLV